MTNEPNILKRFHRHRIRFPEFKAELRARGIEAVSSNGMFHCSRVLLRCKRCAKEWESKVGYLLKGSGCRRCMLLERAKGRAYNADQIRGFLEEMGITLLSDYVNSQKPIQVRFESCGHEIVTTWNQLQQGNRCSQCAPNARFNEEHYADAAKKYGGEILRIAKSGSSPSLWRCSLGHDFSRSLRSIRQLGTFCTYCSGSYAEMLCRQVMERLFSKPFRPIRLPGMISFKGRPLELDMYNDGLKLAVEHNGAHHYAPQLNWGGTSGFGIQLLHDKTRRSFCAENGILLIEIRELGTRTTLEAMRRQIRNMLRRSGRQLPVDFDNIDLTALPCLSESQVYWKDVQEAAQKLGLKILSRSFWGADKPLSVRCRQDHITEKTARSILQGHNCDTCYSEQMKKPLRLSDGRIFESGAAAGRVLGVTKEVVNKAIRQGRKLKGFSLERIS